MPLPVRGNFKIPGLFFGSVGEGVDWAVMMKTK
jgi:hypothetical protein